MSVVTLLLTLLWLREPARRPEVLEKDARPADSVPLSQVLHNLPVVLVLVTVLLMTSYMAALAGTFSLYGSRVLFAGQSASLAVRNVGLIMTALGLVMALTQAALLKPLVSRLGESKLLLLGCLLQLMSAVGLFTSSALGAVIAFVVTFALGYGISSPTLQSLMTHLGPEQVVGRLPGVFQSVNSLAFILSIVWAGAVFDYVSPQAVFAVSAGLLALAMGGSIGIVRHKPGREVAGSQVLSVEATAEGATIRSELGQLT